MLRYETMSDDAFLELDKEEEEEEEEYETKKASLCPPPYWFLLSSCILIGLVLFWYLFSPPPLLLPVVTSSIDLVSLPLHPPSSPVLARIVHLILVENMEEVKEFIDFLPGMMSDVVFNCWNDYCYDPRPQPSKSVYVGSWHSHANQPYRMNKKGLIQSFDRNTDILISTTDNQSGFWKIQPSVYFINELSLNLSRRTTLTESRNRLAAFVEPQEQIQGWQWAYINIMDGDGHLDCPYLETATDSWKFQFDQWNRLLQSSSSREATCWLAFNAFLLTTGPAIGLPVFFDRHDEWKGGMMTYHFDGVVAAFHHEIFHIMHPLCEKFDSWTYWSSQGYLILQSVCLLGHVYTNSFFLAMNKDHRAYPHNPPFLPFTDLAMKEMNLFPERLLYMIHYLLNGDSYKTHLTPVISFDFYTGFNRDEMISSDCITTMLDPTTCIRTLV